jgi:sugar fermentation stimulation protein A
MNPGRMQKFLLPGADILISQFPDGKHKLSFSLKYVVQPQSLILVDCQIPNKILGEALYAKKIPEFAHVQKILPEQSYGIHSHSRMDFLLDDYIFVELKSSNYVDHGHGYFPDAPSTRAQRHLLELMDVIAKNPKNQAWVIFLAQRTDVDSIRPLDLIDPEFGRLLRLGAKMGLHYLGFGISFSADGTVATIGESLPIILNEKSE